MDSIDRCIAAIILQEEGILGQPHAAEGHIVFAGGCPPRGGRSRRVPLAGCKVETTSCEVPGQSRQAKRNTSLPPAKNPRTKAHTLAWLSGPSLKFLLWALKRRRTFCASLQSTVLSPLLQSGRSAMASICHFFLNASKPIAFWQALLDDWSIQAVFDVSPGSGALMEAALRRGAVYHGVCLQLSVPFSSFTETLPVNIVSLLAVSCHNSG